MAVSFLIENVPNDVPRLKITHRSKIILAILCRGRNPISEALWTKRDPDLNDFTRCGIEVLHPTSLLS